MCVKLIAAFIFTFSLYEFSFQNRQQYLETSHQRQEEHNTTATTESAVTDKTPHGDNVEQHIFEIRSTNRGQVSCGSHATKTHAIDECSSPPSLTNSATNNICRDNSHLLEDQSIHLGTSAKPNTPQLNPSNCQLNTSSGSGLDWFDTLKTGQQGSNISPISKTAEHTHIIAQAVPPGLEATSSDFTKRTINAKAAKQPTKKGSRETTANDLPDDVVTEHVSKKWHKLNKKCMKGTTDRPSITELCGYGDQSEEADITFAGPLHSTPARGKKRPLAHEDAQKGTSDVQDPELQAKLAQLAKFSFKQKTKLQHSPGIENELRAASGDNGRDNIVSTQPKQKPAPAEKLRRLLEVSVSSDKVSSVGQGKSSCAATTEVILEKQAPVLDHIVPTSALPNEENKQTASHSRKVSSSTLAKLAKFSFAASSEDKIPDTIGVNPECENPLPSRNLGAREKRQCFQLEPLHNKTIGTSKSLFCSTDLDDDESLDLEY